jgi:hypothetical protein
MVTHYVSKDQKTWDKFIPFLVHAYNTSIHETTGYSPFYLLHGFHPRLLADIAFPDTDLTDNDAKHRLVCLQEARRIAKSRMIQNSIRMKERFDLRRRENPFKPGDLVWIWTVMHHIGSARKLEKSFRGPYKIIARTAPNDFLIEGSDGKQDVVNAERMKPYFARFDHLTHCTPVTRLPVIHEPKSRVSHLLQQTSPALQPQSDMQPQQQPASCRASDHQLQTKSASCQQSDRLQQQHDSSAKHDSNQLNPVQSGSHHDPDPGSHLFNPLPTSTHPHETSSSCQQVRQQPLSDPSSRHVNQSPLLQSDFDNDLHAPPPDSLSFIEPLILRRSQRIRRRPDRYTPY